MLSSLNQPFDDYVKSQYGGFTDERPHQPSYCDRPVGRFTPKGECEGCMRQEAEK